jgi:hypothetical protein
LFRLLNLLLIHFDWIFVHLFPLSVSHAVMYTFGVSVNRSTGIPLGTWALLVYVVS